MPYQKALNLKHVTVNLGNILTHGFSASVTVITVKATSNQR